MRLLHAKDMTLEEFTKPPRYAILSHRWRRDEVLFHDIQDLPHAKTLKGYSKVSHACAKAVEDGFDWIWIDTCCIDKTSSAELSEAINSMYAWYRDAAVCYAYLDDVHSNDDCEARGSSFRRSRWFTRGWTLQELIAPRRVVFFSRGWTDIGTRAGLVDTIETITRVHRLVLLKVPVKLSIAARMSWAAGRETTRVEDRAYSLMGIFGVNMPAIYGEGEQAFIRLQHEILKQSNDHSIFAWTRDKKLSSRQDIFDVLKSNTSPEDLAQLQRGVLASSPNYFFRCASNIAQLPYEQFERRFSIANSVPEHSVTNYGIRIRLPLDATIEEDVIRSSDLEYHLAALACTPSDEGPDMGTYTICILLAKIPDTSNQFVRMTDSLVAVRRIQTFTAKDVYICQEPALRLGIHDALSRQFAVHAFEIRDPHLEDYGSHIFFLNGSTTGTSHVGIRGMREFTRIGLVLKTFLAEEDHSAFGAVVFKCKGTGLVFAAVIGVERLPGMPADAACPWVDVLVEDETDTWLSAGSIEDKEQMIQTIYGGNWRDLDRNHPRRRLSDTVTKGFERGFIRLSLSEVEENEYRVHVQIEEKT